MLKLLVGMGLLLAAGCGGATEQTDPPPVAVDAAQPAPERDAGVATDASVDASNGDACLRSAVVCECLPTGKTAPVVYGPECDRDGAQVVCDRQQQAGAMLCPTDAGTD